jgi:uncharacterized protein (TIRG00374 family)
LVKLLRNKQLWGTIVAIALLAWCVKDVRADDLVELSHRIDYLNFVPAVALAFAYLISRGLRWRLLVSQQKQLTVYRGVSLYSAGQILNVVMPVLTGQVGRLFLFAKKEGMRKTFVFSTIVLEILFDAISLVVFLLFTSLAFAFPQQYRQVSFVIAIVSTVILIALYLILNYQERLEEFGRSHFRDRWPGFYIVVKKFIRSFTKGIKTLRSSQHLIGSLLYSMVGWTAHMFIIYFLLKAFGFQLPIAASAAVMVINTLALMIPITPANAGTFEVAVTAGLSAFSVGRGDAVLFALALHLLDLIPVFALGGLFLHSEKLSLREIKAQNEDRMLLSQVSEEGELVEQEEHH